MHYRVEQRNDVAVHFHRVRHHDGVVVNAQDPLRDAGFAVAGAAIEEQGLVADQGRAKLIQQSIGDQLAKMLLAGDVHDGDVVPVNVSPDGDSLILG